MLQKNQPLKVVKRILEDSTGSPTPASAGKPARDSPSGRQSGKKSKGGARKEGSTPMPKNLRHMGSDATPEAATPPLSGVPIAR